MASDGFSERDFLRDSSVKMQLDKSETWYKAYWLARRSQNVINNSRAAMGLLGFYVSFLAKDAIATILY